MTLRMMRPLVRSIDSRSVRPPAKVMNAIYNSPEFIAWRARVLERAGHRCEALDDHGHRCAKAQPGHRLYADHIIELRDGGAPFDLNNGQALCASHHELKTNAARARRLKG